MLHPFESGTVGVSRLSLQQVSELNERERVQGKEIK
jgi:hypothetical protein